MLLEAFLKAVRLLYVTSFLWLPVFLVGASIYLWLSYIRALFIQKQKKILFEIRVPQIIEKSPAAMEIFLSALYQKGSGTYLETYLEGKVPPWFSLELVSISGKVHFYIWTWEKFKEMIQHQLYAQFPNIEIYEVEDYTSGIPFDPENWPMWGTYFKLTEKDAFPIKTYVDYGLDQIVGEKDIGKQIEPMTAVLEYLGSLKEGEQAWIQILIMANRKEGLKEGRLFKKPDWKDAVKKEINAIVERASPKDGMPPPPLTVLDNDRLQALNRSLSKTAFDVAIRGIYISKKESFNGNNIPGLIGSFRQYSSNTLNGFKLGWLTDFDYPWQDFRGTRLNKAKRQILEAYKMRSYFQAPYKYFKERPLVLTTEELATIWHFPSGLAAQTPTLSRIESKRGEAPANLPT